MTAVNATMELAPRFRTDLTVRRQETSGAACYVVKDPATDNFYRFGEVEQFLTQQCDGRTPLTTIRQRAEEKFGAALAPEMLRAFLERLKKTGLLESEIPGPGQRRPPRRVSGNLLALRFRWFDPDRLFNWLVHKVRGFFTPAFLWISAGLILSGAFIAFARWEDVAQNFAGVYQLSNLPLVSLVIFLVITAHEFAHGLTCKHFGGEVHEMGFLLIYLQPAMYCNVSDAWLFPEKSKRLWVGFAGPYFELFLWALATLAWRVTDVETAINQVAYIVMTSSGVKTLFNFNPLIKLDGYYLLSDWLEIPNLRKRSFALVGDAIKRAFGVKAAGRETATQRERLVCLAYGLVAAAGSFAVLAIAFVKLGGYLMDQSQPLALALFVGLLGLKVRRRFRRFFGGRDNATGDPDDDLPEATTPTPEVTAPVEKKPDPPADPQKPTAAAAPPETPEPARPAKRKKRSLAGLKLFLKLAFLGAAVSAILVWGISDLRIAGPFDVLPLHNADVRAAVEGIVDEICVAEGDQVRQGDLIARLADRDVRADLKKTEAQIEENRSRLKLLEAGTRPEEIELAKTTIARTVEQLKFARSRLERDRILYEDKLVSLNDYEDSRRMVASCESDLAEAKKKLDVLLAGSRVEEMDAMRSAIVSLETQRHYLEEQLVLMRVLSPASGVVATPQRQLEEMKHQLVKKGDLIAKVFDLKIITAEIAISERDISDVKIGQEVVLKVRAFPDETFRGKVTSIATSAQISTSASSSAVAQAQTPGGQTTLTRSAVAPKTILITTEIDNASLHLKPEMTGQAKIICGEHRFIDLLTRRIARTIKVEFWSWW